MDIEHAINIVNVSGNCFDHTTEYGDGIWNEKYGESILRHSLFRLHFQLILIFGVSHLLHLLLKRFLFPRVTSDVLTGMILGASVFRKYFQSESEVVFPVPNQVIVQMSKVGYLIFTFMAAVRMDPRLVKYTGLKACILAVVLAGIPRSMIQTINIIYNTDEELPPSISATSLISTRQFFNIITNSWFVGVSTILMQQKITNSRLGHMALSSALLSEILKVFMNFGSGVYLFGSTISPRVSIQILVLTAGVTLLIFIVLRALIFFFIERTPEGKLVNSIFTSIMVAMTFVVSSLGDSTGTNYLLFPMILGLVVPSGSPLATSLVAKVDPIITGFFTPLLTIYTASKFDLQDFFTSFNRLLQFQSTLIAYAIKMAATFLTVLCLKIPTKDAAALTLILNMKSFIEMGYLLSFTNLEMEDISITSLIFLVCILASIAPPLVKWLYNPEKQYIGHIKKSIEQTASDTELKVLACALRQEDAIAAVKLFEFSNPTKNSPLSICGLCLDQLIGSDLPLLIDHQFRQKASSNQFSRLQTSRETFQYLKSRNKKSVEVQLFTAISHVQQMHEDICWLAFDRGVSLIVLPFHKKWNSRGKLVSSNDNFRNLNNSVLDRAPCSVGILIDHSRTCSLSSVFDRSTAFRVAILFVEGPDDREALAYALRMAGSPKVELQVVHFTSLENGFQDKWEKMLNSEAIRKVRPPRTPNVQYAEEVISDGSDTAKVVRSIQKSNFDLVIVGRRHESETPILSGLSEWNELPELGTIGDMLSSGTVIDDEVSTLVIQQQIMRQSHSSILN